MGPNIREQASQWLTPNVPNGGRSVPEALVQSKGMTEDGEKRTVGLESQVKFWGTPQARDYRSPDSPDSPNYQRKLREGYTIDLNSQASNWQDDPAVVSAWPTPASRDYRTPNLESLESLEDRGGGTKGEQLPNFIEHHFLPLVQPTSDGQELSRPRLGWRQPLPIHLVTPTSGDSIPDLSSGSWDGQLVGRRT